ncbi:MAG: hypothetical protein ACM3ZB_05895 [bacterium]
MVQSDLGPVLTGQRLGRHPLKRLVEGETALERFDAERERRNDPRFGRTTEDRIVWGRLIELELQDIDEQLNRICCSPGRDGSDEHSINAR